MFLVAGLGNPGTKYAATRHNIGFDSITYFSDRYDVRVGTKEGYALTGRMILEGEKVLLAMPQTYMNESGRSIRALKDFYKFDTKDIIILCDDINLDIGKIRVRPKGSAGGHNGLKSIIAHLGTEEFTRVRIGVGGTPENGNLIDHVLGRFGKEEDAKIRDIFELVHEAVTTIITDGTDAAMNKVNGKQV
ncbi:MAG: aminoacyl-tRNA hydrolase [Eubacterium sp.]|nr:aminoacyl-tRNA hydrolase [Eubacterium sp.]